MARKRYTPETIIRKLREAEVLQGQGKTVAEMVKQLGVTEQTFYRWRNHYNTKRPHSARGYRPRAPEVVMPKGKKGALATGQMAA